MKLSVVRCSQNLKDSFINFNQTIYSNRITALQQATYKWEIQKKDNYELHLLALDDQQVVGQIILIPVKCLYKDNTYPAVFAYDYIVHPDYLNTGVGVKLLSKTIKEHIHFGMGVSDISRKLHLVLKEKSVGAVYKFLFVRNPLAYFFAAFHSYFKLNLRNNITKIYWPDYIDTGIYKIESMQALPTKSKSWNKDIIEFARDEDFYAMRFKDFKSKYHYYHLLNSEKNVNGYFTVRTDIWRGMRVLIVSDYRFTLNDSKVFEAMIFGIKKLAKINKLDAVLFGSSLSKIDTHLMKHQFRKVGIASEILTNFPLDEGWDNKAAKRELIWATPADSDFEFNIGEDLWKK